ncbi:MAG: GGDEF domain-containing protein [Candidatus Hydrogenedentota bacterium]
MSKMRVPVTPENYHVWFEHVSSVNPELSAVIEDRIRNGQPFTDEVNSSLFLEFIGFSRGDLLAKHAREQSRALLRMVFEEILTAGTLATEYGDNLTRYAEALGETSDLGDIQGIVRGLIQDTRHMGESSRKMKDRLDEAKAEAEELKQQLQVAERDANTDALTGLYNRKAIDKRLEELLAAFRENREAFSVIMSDVDHFKKFNDTHGHNVGDHVLKLMGETLTECIKGVDFAARYGGEEFMVILPTTDRAGATAVAEQIRSRTQRKKLRVRDTGEMIGQITMSLGVSQVNAQDTPESLVKRADRALYLAKDSGRNNVKTELDLS